MPAPATLPPPKGCRYLPITGPIAYHTILDSRQLTLPVKEGAFRCIVGRGRSEFSRVWKSWAPAGVSRMTWEGYAWAETELAQWLTLRRRGMVNEVTLRHDAQMWGRVEPKLKAACEAEFELELLPSHGKAMVGEWQGGCAALQSSSNDGSAPDVEWYTVTRDPAVCSWLAGDAGWGQSLPAANVPMLLQCGPELASAAVLKHMMAQVDDGGGVDLLLMSMTTSKAFLEQLIQWRKDGVVESMAWLLDGGIRQRLAGQSSGKHAADKKGQTDINPLLDSFQPGQILHPTWKPHCKAAVVKGRGGKAVTLLSTANWQTTNPRVEHYVVLPGAEAAEWMTSAGERVLRGEAGRAEQGEVNGGIPGILAEDQVIQLPDVPPEPEAHADRVSRAYSAQVDARRFLERSLRLCQQQAEAAARAGDEYTLSIVLAQGQQVAAKLSSMALAEVHALSDASVKTLLAHREASEHDTALAAETQRLLEGLKRDT